MKRIGKIKSLLILLIPWIWGIGQVMSQTEPAGIWASVQFNKKKVVVGEPLMATITVYTSTWFTSPPKFSEIQVPGAIMVEYEQRSGAVRKTIGNKSYPAIEKKFIVYPFRPGENTMPEVEIVVESPDEGDYKGKRRVIRSPERQFQVDALPVDTGMVTLFTAFNVTVAEKWSRTLVGLAQGDVLERSFVIRATGALAALIPPLEIPEGEYGNVYSQKAELSNVQNAASVTGTRTEKWTYLLEKAGKYAIPGISLSWFNPGSGEVESVTTESHEFVIAENPNLDFLLTMQDSLKMMLEGNGEIKMEQFEWLGMNWWQLSLAVLSGIVMIFLIYRFIVFIMSEFSVQKKKRSESEEKHFQLLGEMSREGDPGRFFNQLLKWYDRFPVDGPKQGLNRFLMLSGEDELIGEYNRLNRVLFSGGRAEKWTGDPFYELLKRYRRKYLYGNKKGTAQYMPDINP